MRGSKIVFIVLFVNLLVIYLGNTTEVEFLNPMILLLLTIPLGVLLFLVKESFLEFFKYMVYLVLMTVVYYIVSPFITYRSEVAMERKAFINNYKKSCVVLITKEKELKEKVEKWKEIVNSDNKFPSEPLNEFRVILYFMDSHNSLYIMSVIEESTARQKAVLLNILENYLRSSIEKAITHILKLPQEERSLYKVDNICYLSQKSELSEEIKEEDYKHKEVQKFLFKTCEGY